MQFLEWYGQHPCLGTIMLIVLGIVMVSVVKAIFSGLADISQ